MNKYEITVATFNKQAQKYQDKYMNFDFYFDTYDKFCELVTTSNASVLDVGCGPGNISKYLLNKRPDLNIHGIDLAPKMIELAKINNPSAQFDVLDTRELDRLESQYDAIMCGFCAPYLSKQDVENFIKNARKLINTGGVLYISAMEGEDVQTGYQTSSAGDQVYTHYHQAEHFIKSLERNKFKVLEVKRKQFPAELSSNTTDIFVYAMAVE